MSLSVSPIDNKTPIMPYKQKKTLNAITPVFNNLSLDPTVKLSLRERNILLQSDLIGELIKHGKYEKEEGDTAHTTSESVTEYIGENHGNKRTRRLYLEILRQGIDLFLDEVLERIKSENNELYHIILLKAYGHVNSAKGIHDHVNLEGSCEALSLLMLVHSVEAERDACLNKDSHKKLSHIAKVLRNAITAESTDDEIKIAYKKIVAGEDQLVCSGYDWHSEVLLYSKVEETYKMVYHNRGNLKTDGEEIQIYSIDSRVLDEMSLRQISDRFRMWNTFSQPSTAHIISTPNARKTNYYPLKDSKAGHCTHASPKAAIFSLMTLYDGYIYYGSYRDEYKDFTRAHRARFKQIFSKHPPKITYESTSSCP